MASSRSNRARDARPAEPPPAILWIDDAVDAADPGVRLLTLEGFAVDCADSGGAGLSMLGDRAYDAVILDLRLPDISGLLVLEELHAKQLSVPVLMLTGYGDAESATTALGLGVHDFRWKPLMGDELVAVVRGVVRAGAASRASGNGNGNGHSHDNGHGNGHANNHANGHINGHVNGNGVARRGAQVLAVLSKLVAERVEAEACRAGETPAADAAVVSRELRLRIVAALVRALDDPGLDVRGFLACAAAIRYALTASDAASAADFGARLRDLLRPPAARSVEHAKVRQAIALLESAVGDRMRMSEVQLAHGLGIDPAHLGRVMRAQTGLGFREWRSALAVRVAVRALRAADAQVAQIAFDVGYEHPSQLDREFRRLFGVSPRAFRRVLLSVG